MYWEDWECGECGVHVLHCDEPPTTCPECGTAGGAFVAAQRHSEESTESGYLQTLVSHFYDLQWAGQRVPCDAFLGSYSWNGGPGADRLSFVNNE